MIFSAKRIQLLTAVFIAWLRCGFRYLVVLQILFYQILEKLSSLINSETTKRGKTFYEGQLEGYLNAVRMTEEYKAKPKRYEKIISEALKTTIPRTVPKARNKKEI